MFASIIYAIGGFIEAIIGLRFVFELLGANPASGFVNWIYSWSTPFVAPFSGIFGQSATITGHGTVTTSVFDWTALIALVVYAILLAILSTALNSRHYYAHTH